MTASQRTIARVRRRLVLGRGLRLAGWTLLVLAVVSAVTLVVAQVVGFAVPGAWYAWAGGGALAGALAMGLIAARLGRPAADAVAVRVDERLGLKDTLSTARYAESLADGAVARRVREDAEAVAGGVAKGRLREAFPVMPTRVWGWALGGVAGVAVLSLDPLGLVERATNRNAQAAVADATAEAARDALEEAKQAADTLAEKAEPETAESEAGSPADALDPETLSERLTAMLSQRDLANPEDRREAAAEVSDLHDLASEQAETREKEVQAMENLLSGMDPGEPGPATEFAQAMRRSDFAQARQELSRMGDALANGQLSDAQKQQMSEQLATMGEQLRQRAKQQRQQAQAAEQAAQQALRDAGLTEEQVEQLGKKSQDADAVKDALEEAKPPQSPQERRTQEAQAEKLAEQNRDAAEQKDRGEQAGDRAEQMAEQMKKMADAVGEDPPQEPSTADAAQDGQNGGQEGGDEGAQEQTAGAESQPGEQPGGQDGEEGGEQNPQQTGEQPGDEAGAEPSQQAGSRDSGEQGETGEPGEPGEPGSEPGGEQGSQSAEASQSESRSEPRTEQQKQQQMSEAMQQMQEQLGQSEQQQQGAEGAKSAARSLQQAMQQMSGQPGAQPGAQPGSQPGAQPGGQGNQPGPPTGVGGQQAGAMPGPGKGQGSGGNPLGAERPALGAGSHVSKDIQEGRGGRVLSSWTEGGEMEPGEARLEFDAAVTEARAEAERAVGDDRTPQRYHKAIRDYFGNLPEAPPAPAQVVE